MASASKVSQTPLSTSSSPTCNLFAMHLNHLKPRAARLRSGSCGLLCGHQVPQLLVHLPGHHLSLLASQRGMEVRHLSQLGDHLAQHAHKSHLLEIIDYIQVRQLRRHQPHLQAHQPLQHQLPEVRLRKFPLYLHQPHLPRVRLHKIHLQN